MESKYRAWGLMLILAVVTASRIGRWHQTQDRFRQVGREVEVQMRVAVPARTAGRAWKLPYQAWQVYCPNNLSGCDRWPLLAAGDRLKLKAEWQTWETGGVYLNTVRVERLVRLEPGMGSPWWWLRRVEELRQKLLAIYRASLSEPYSSLLSGIVLGEQGEFDEDLYRALITTGTVHLVAASGYNISVVAGALTTILVIWMRRKAALTAAMAGIIGYVILAGASPPVIRAGLMGGLVILAQLSGRRAEVKWGVWLSLLMMLVIWPWMVRSISFGLSAAATLGLIWGSPAVARVINRWRGGRDWGESARRDLTTTLAAGLVTMPLIWGYFGRVSLIAPLTNLAVLWLVPPLMALGGVMGVLGLAVIPLARITGWLVYPPLWLMTGIIQQTAKLPLASLEVGQGNWLIALAWWGVVGWWWLRSRGD